MITVVSIFQAIILLITLFLAVIYSSSILFFHEIRHRNNILTVNVCFATIGCCIYWILYSVTLNYYLEFYTSNNTCHIMNYFQIMSTLQIPLATIVVSIHRFCCIIYHSKAFFKKIRWIVICITAQWIIAIICPIPLASFNTSNCVQYLWMDIYTLIIVVIIPSVICLIINLSIFRYVRLSSKRIQPALQMTRNSANTNRPKGITRRDLHLLRHTIVMFCIFIGGWSPIFILRIIQRDLSFDSLSISILIVLSESALLIGIINLFLYNHALRECLKKKFCKCK